MTVADTHVKFKLLRKESRDNGEVPFQSPHIEIPWADPVHLLRRALWMTHRELCARGDEEALNGFMMGAQWLLPSDLRTMSATDTVGEHNTRLQGYVDMLRLKGPSGSPLDVGTHSLRSGLINSAFMLGMDIQKIMLHTDHRDVDSLLQYARRVQLEHKDYSLPNDMLFTLRIGGSDPAKPPIVQEVQQLLRPSVEAGELCSLPGCVAQRRNGRGIMALIDAA